MQHEPEMSSLVDRDAPLDMAPEEFRRIGHALVDRVADFLDSLPDRRVAPGESRDAVRRVLRADQSLPEDGIDAAPLLDRSADLLFEHSLFNGHPRFWGYITSSAAPIGALGDLLAAAVNPNVGSWMLSPVATEIEAQSVRWIAELIGYPASCGGLLVSGGNMANFVCFLAARTAKAAWKVQQTGLAGHNARQLRAYASREAHTWVQKAADLFGLGTDAIRWIETDDRHRMDPAALGRQIESDRGAGDQPFLVVATAGSVSTGAVDPLWELSTIAKEENLWFHVDGAYGGFAAAVPGVAEDFGALAVADSIAVDPHKWLYAPLEAGCALVSDPASLRDAFSYHPPYYHFDEESLNYVDLGPQNSRGFRALKVWLGLQRAGRSGMVRMIDQDIRLARKLFELLARHSELEPVTQNLSITTFRYVPADLRARTGLQSVEDHLNRLNQALLTRIETGGEAFLSNAVVDGRFLLRLCIVNFRTALEDIEALPEIVTRIGRHVDGELRPGALSSCR